MRTNVPRALLGLALAGVLCLSGCSDGKSDSGNDTGGANAGASESSASPGAPDETPTSSPEDSPSESEFGDDLAGDADGDKPARDRVIKGYQNVITAQSPVELPAGIVKQTATCFVDAIYDEASIRTLQAIAEEDATGIDPADTSLFSEASVACTKEITG